MAGVRRRAGQPRVRGCREPLPAGAWSALEQATAGSGRRFDPNCECDLVLRLGRAELRSGQAGARDTLLRRSCLARGLGDPARMAEAVLAINRAGSPGSGERTARSSTRSSTRSPRRRPDDSQVLAELLAALASEVVWSDDGDRRYELSERALAMARRVGDDAHDRERPAPAQSDDRVTRHARPTGRRVRRAAVDRGRAPRPGRGVPGRVPPERHRDGGRQRRRRPTRWSSSRAASPASCNQPSLLFHTSMMRTSRRILEGALDEAERGAYTTFELGQRANQGAEALIFFTELLLEIRRWQGRLSEMLPEFADLAGMAGIDFGYSLVRYLYDAGEVRARPRAVPRRDPGTTGSTAARSARRRHPLQPRVSRGARRRQDHAHRLYDALRAAGGVVREHDGRETDHRALPRTPRGDSRRRARAEDTSRSRSPPTRRPGRRCSWPRPASSGRGSLLRLRCRSRPARRLTDAVTRDGYEPRRRIPARGGSRPASRFLPQRRLLLLRRRRGRRSRP